MGKGVKDDYLKSMSKKISRLTWQGKLWGKEGAIALSRARLNYLRKIGRGWQGQGQSALSSTFYTAWGNALARTKLSWPLAIFWLAVNFYCLWRAVRLSDQFRRRTGIKNMTVGELDVRASILAAAFFRPRHYLEAMDCIREAITRRDVSSDSMALLLRKEGEIYDNIDLAENADCAFITAVAIPGIKPATRVRVLVSFARHELKCRRKKDAEKQLAKALTLAKKHNLGDQILKIRALMKKAK